MASALAVTQAGSCASITLTTHDTCVAPLVNVGGLVHIITGLYAASGEAGGVDALGASLMPPAAVVAAAVEAVGRVTNTRWQTAKTAAAYEVATRQHHGELSRWHLPTATNGVAPRSGQRTSVA